MIRRFVSFFSRVRQIYSWERWTDRGWLPENRNLFMIRWHVWTKFFFFSFLSTFINNSLRICFKIRQNIRVVLSRILSFEFACSVFFLFSSKWFSFKLLQDEILSLPSRCRMLITSELRRKWTQTCIDLLSVQHFNAHFVFLTSMQIYSLYKNNKNFFHDLSLKDKIQRGNIVGDRRAIETNDQHVMELLDGHLGRLITGDDTKFV